MRSRTARGIVALCFLLVPAVQSVIAETAGEEAEEWMEEGPHELGLFLGVTDKEGDTGFSAGIDYQYRINRWVGVGGLVEYTGSDFREGVFGVPLYLHAWKELTLVTAPAIEIEPADREGALLLRVGADYGFRVGRGFVLAPSLYLDFTSEDVAVVYGITVARSF